MPLVAFLLSGYAYNANSTRLLKAVHLKEKEWQMSSRQIRWRQEVHQPMEVEEVIIITTVVVVALILWQEEMAVEIILPFPAHVLDDYHGVGGRA